MDNFIYVFNPEHDMALAVFSPYYKPSADIVGMASDLAALPAWVASRGDAVHAPAACAAWACGGEYADLLPELQWADGYLNLPCKPWGWNPALCSALRACGLEEKFLPPSTRLEAIRDLSGRHRYVSLLSDLRRIPGTCGRAVACVSFQDVLQFLDTEPEVVLKAPWSGSGRGIVRISSHSLTPSVEGWVRRTIRTQKRVMAEPLCNKIMDFAMEFYASPSGEVSFVGYSLFETDAHGNYKSNRLLANERIETILAAYVPVALLHQVRDELLSYFYGIFAGVHEGYLGVDMMVCRGDTGEYLLHPLVEVNLRMNMGVFSRLFFDRYCVPSASGRYAVEYFRSEKDASLFDAKMRTDYPLQVSAHRVISGYLPLIPVSDHTHYVAYVIILG